MIYILHFDSPYFHARHYVGYCTDGTLEERLARHRSGQGSRLMLAIELAGIGFTVALTHAGDRHFERRLKRAKNTARFCPLCPKQRKAARPSRTLRSS
jgi:transposase